MAKQKRKTIRFIDLFAGLSGTRIGLEQALDDAGIAHECVFTSEIKPYAVKVLQDNHPNETIAGDITEIDKETIPDFDILLGGFPCQAFSAAGKRLGFADTRGTLFFEIEEILRVKKPKGFILENVEGLTNHDHGNTLKTILAHLDALKYKVTYKVLNSKDFGIPQDRRRIYIVGTRRKTVSLDGFDKRTAILADILESGKPTEDSKFIRSLLKRFSPDELCGKSIKDKRGGSDNIHSWDLDMKGRVKKEERRLLNLILTERRKKKWAERYGIDWMDGMPLTIDFIREFYDHKDLQDMLERLVGLGYLVYEHPKKLVTTAEGVTYREYDVTLPKGYNIVAGKLSFPISKILDPQGISPTLVAMDMTKLYVVDGTGLRKLTLREGLRLFGYPDDYILDVDIKEGYDLLGNTVVVPVIKAVATRLIQNIKI